VVGAKHRADEVLLDARLTLTRFEVDVKELKWPVVGRTGHVAPQLDIALEDRWKWDVGRGVVVEEGWGVDDGGAGLVHPEIVEGNSRPGKNGGEGEGLGGREIGLLQAQDVGGREEVAKASRDDITAMNKVGRSAVVGQAVDIIGNDARNRKRKIGGEEKGGGRTSRTERATRHLNYRKRGNGGHSAPAGFSISFSPGASESLGARGRQGPESGPSHVLRCAYQP